MVITRALANKRIPLYGTGFNVRDWIYVDDHCRALLKVLEQGETGTVYNIGARQCRRNHDVLTYILEVLDKPWDLIELVEDRKGHDWRYAIDPTRIESLGWAAQESWETGIRKTIAWYEDNHCSLQRKAAKRQA
jgi:dTDP-glucose 4,6-dehydratase